MLVFSLFAGLIITVALQLLMTSIGAAFGLSIISFSTPENPTAQDKAKRDHAEFSLPITHLAGAGIALSQTVVLFGATLAATFFGQFEDPVRGLIFGIILWSSYWILLLGLSSSTVAGITDSLISAAAGGSKQLIATLQNALKDRASDAVPQDPIETLRTDIQALSKQQEQMPDLLHQQHQLFLNEIKKQRESRTGQHYSHHQSMTPTSQINVKPQESEAQKLSHQSNARSSTLSRVAEQSIHTAKQALSSAVDELDLPNWKELLSTSLQNIDLSDWDSETLWHQMKSLHSKGPANSIQNAVIRDAENFITHAPAWLLKQPQLETEFFERLYDPEADPLAVKEQLLQIDRETILKWLKQRKDLSSKGMQTLADSFIGIQKRILQTLPIIDPNETDEIQILPEIQKKILNYCRYTNRDVLSSEGIETKLIEILETYSQLPAVDEALNLDEITEALERRKGVSKRQWQPIIQSIKATWSDYCDRPSDGEQTVLNAPRPWAMRITASPKSLGSQINQQLMTYLSYQEKAAFTPTAIAKDLGQIIQTGLRSLPDISELRELSNVFNADARHTWQQILEQRSDMTLEEIEPILNWCESAWGEMLQITEQKIQPIFNTFRQGASAPKIAQESMNLVEAMSEQWSAPMEKLQSHLEYQTETLKSGILTQADAAKNTLKIAAWWLSASLLFSGTSAAIAGWIAACHGFSCKI